MWVWKITTNTAGHPKDKRLTRTHTYLQQWRLALVFPSHPPSLDFSRPFFWFSSDLVRSWSVLSLCSVFLFSFLSILSLDAFLREPSLVSHRDPCWPLWLIPAPPKKKSWQEPMAVCVTRKWDLAVKSQSPPPGIYFLQRGSPSHRFPPQTSPTPKNQYLAHEPEGTYHLQSTRSPTIVCPRNA